MENRKYNTRPVVEAGLISAIIVVLMLITGYVPFLNFMGTMLLPIPVAILYMRHNIKVTLTAIAASTLITAMLFDPIGALISAVSFALIGITLGYLFKKDKSSTFIIVLMTAISLAVLILTTILTITLIQRTTFAEFFARISNDLKETMTLSINMLKESYKNANMSPEQLEQMEQAFKVITPEFLMNGLGGVVILESFVSGILNYTVAKLVLQKLGYNIRKMVAFTEIYISSFGGLMLTIPVIIGMVFQTMNVSFGKPVFISGMLLLFYTFLIIGSSVAAYFLRNRYKLGKGLIIIIIIFTILNPTFSLVYIGIGFIDMLLDFRRLNPNRILKK